MDSQEKSIQILGRFDPHVDNMLRITNDGRKLALDMRLINPLAADDPNGKVAVCSRNVYKRGRRRPFCGAAHSFASVNFQNMQFILVKVLFLVLLSCILASLSASFTCQFPVLLVKKHFPIIKKEGYSHE